MDRYGILTMRVVIGLVLILIGSEHFPNARSAGPVSQVRPDAVLRADDDAKTIIRKAVKAYGGKKVFSRWNCGYLKYKTNGGVVPKPLGGVILEDTFQLPGHFKRVIRRDASEKEFVMIFVVNNGKGWTKKGDGPAEPIENDFTKRTVVALCAA